MLFYAESSCGDRVFAYTFDMTKTKFNNAPTGYTGQIKATVTTERGYFSITAEIGTPNQLKSGNFQAGGCLHEDIAKKFPKLRPLIPLHLSNVETGAPMHAEENGFYWLAKAAGIPMRWEPEQDEETCLKFYADHCRIDMHDAEFDAAEVKKAYDMGERSVATSEEVTQKCKEEMNKAGVLLARKWFADKVGEMRPRWKSEAKAGLALIESL